ncbi:MarR family transcriptional regulator, partial [Lactobacillus sp. XV13L]|nr:MarR family transcriptional regulator [Lactobacillus sp. XV13L]
MKKQQMEKISRLLTTIYTEIIQVEQRELRKSTFNDVSIHEMHAVNAITMYEHKTSSQIARELKISPGTVTS